VEKRKIIQLAEILLRRIDDELSEGRREEGMEAREKD